MGIHCLAAREPGTGAKSGMPVSLSYVQELSVSLSRTLGGVVFAGVKELSKKHSLHSDYSSLLLHWQKGKGCGSTRKSVFAGLPCFVTTVTSLH